jgi:hypothetical protein
MVWVACLLFLEKVESQTVGRLDARSLAIFVLAAYAVAVKLSTLPILLLPLYLGWRELAWRQPASLLPVSALLVVLAPWLMQNVMLSGYLIYPFPQLDLFNVDWKVPADLALKEQRTVLSWARAPRVPMDQVLAMTPGQWIPLWLRHIAFGEVSMMFVIVALTPLYLAAANMSLRDKASRSQGLIDRLALVVIAYCGLLYWFWSAPAGRFGWGFLILLFLLLTTSLFQGIIRRFSWRLLCLVFGPLLVGELYPLYIATNPPQLALAESMLLPPDYPVKPVRTQQARNFEVYGPIGTDQCWYVYFPCAPYDVKSVELRGPELKDGLRFNPG